MVGRSPSISSVWLPVVVLRCLAPAWCQQVDNEETLLVGVRNTVNGVGITVFRRESDCHSDSEASGKWTMTQIPVVGHSLSSECGNWYFRCQDLLVETLHQQNDTEFSIIIFIPLENAALLFRYWNLSLIHI